MAGTGVYGYSIVAEAPAAPLTDRPLPELPSSPPHATPDRSTCRAASPAPSKPPLLIGGRTNAAASPPRILLVEDNLINQKVASRMLEKNGHTVVIANNGKEALDTLAEQDFDAVVMDVQMPEMDGLEATAAIRAGEQGTGRRLPILALTAHALNGDRERCLRAGMDGYIAKPVQGARLLQALAEVVGLRDRRDRALGSPRRERSAGTYRFAGASWQTILLTSPIFPVEIP